VGDAAFGRRHCTRSRALTDRDDERERRRRAVRSAIILGLVALAVYVTFIVMTAMRNP